MQCMQTLKSSPLCVLNVILNPLFLSQSGTIPLRELVYRVQALPPSMLPLVWDFGQLNAEIEAKYIRQIVQRYVSIHNIFTCDKVI